jgi:hypothetical protein
VATAAFCFGSSTFAIIIYYLITKRKYERPQMEARREILERIAGEKKDTDHENDGDVVDKDNVS